MCKLAYLTSQRLAGSSDAQARAARGAFESLPGAHASRTAQAETNNPGNRGELTWPLPPHQFNQSVSTLLDTAGLLRRVYSACTELMTCPIKGPPKSYTIPGEQGSKDVRRCAQLIHPKDVPPALLTVSPQAARRWGCSDPSEARKQQCCVLREAYEWLHPQPHLFKPPNKLSSFSSSAILALSSIHHKICLPYSLKEEGTFLF